MNEVVIVNKAKSLDPETFWLWLADQKKGVDAVNVRDILADANRPVRARSRLLVHVILLFTLLASLVPLLIFSLGSRVAIHVVIACMFIAFVLVHLGQRRKTVRALLFRLTQFGSGFGNRGRLARSDAVFVFLMLNVLTSGSLDLSMGRNIMIPGLGIAWHALSSLLLLSYLLAHVIRRRRRIRSSQIS
ncbi:MAG: hypothetical protein M0Z39_10530 [Actinomycetota bacterium]|nr:hypothetical protein [Actinomycetota bacterium]